MALLFPLMGPGGRPTAEESPASPPAGVQSPEPGSALARELARYLGCRPDLLPIGREREAAALGRGVARPEAEVDRLLDEELGDGAGSPFAWLDRQPLAVSPLLQWHAARSTSGELLTVKLSFVPAPSRGELEEAAEWLGRALQLDAPPVAASSFSDSFRRRLRGQGDLGGELRALRELWEDSGRLRGVVAPGVFEALSTRRVLTRERLAGEAGEEGEAGGRGEVVEARLRRLCRLWLQRALAGESYPLEPGERTVQVLSGGEVAFLEGPFGRLPREIRGDLAAYLDATAEDRPERAARRLLAAAEVDGGELAGLLEHGFRHLSPFRDGGWLPEGDRLARRLLAQWRRAAELDLGLPPAWVDFHSALTALAAEAARRAPGRDVLQAAWQELELGRVAKSLVGLVDDGRAVERLERQVGLLLGLPGSLDRRLDAIRREREEGRREPSRVSRRRRGGRGRVLLALALGLLTTAGVAGQFRQLPGVEAAGALILLLLGALFLVVSLR